MRRNKSKPKLIKLPPFPFPALPALAGDCDPSTTGGEADRLPGDRAHWVVADPYATDELNERAGFRNWPPRSDSELGKSTPRSGLPRTMREREGGMEEGGEEPGLGEGGKRIALSRYRMDPPMMGLFSFRPGLFSSSSSLTRVEYSEWLLWRPRVMDWGEATQAAVG